MHAAAFRVLRTANSPVSRRACRIVAGVRRPLPQRSFHSSAHLSQAPKDTEPEESKKDESAVEKPEPVAENGSAEQSAPSPGETSAQGDVESVAVPQKVRLVKSSWQARANRRKQPEGLPPVILPNWFWDKNVKCLGDPVDLSGSLAVYGGGDIPLHKSSEEVENAGAEKEDKPASDNIIKEALEADKEKLALRQVMAMMECDLKPTAEAKYSIHVDVYREILTIIRSALALRPPNLENKDIRRPILLLQCPKDGGTYYLDSVVETIATKLEADLVRLDAEDIAHLVSNYAEENLAWTPSSTALLSYETSQVAGKLEEFGYSPDQDDPEDLEDNEGKAVPSTHAEWVPSRKEITKNLAFASTKLAAMFKGKQGGSGSPGILDIVGGKMFSKSDLGKGVSIFEIPGRGDPSQGNGKTASDQWNDLKTQTLLDALVSGADSKRLSNPEATVEPSSNSVPRDLIIQVRDFKEMGETRQGAVLISKLRDIVNKRWQNGRNIILVGTTSMEQAQPVLSRAEIQELEAGDVIGYENKTIYVPPDRREEQDIAFEADEKSRILNLNVRHIEDMIIKLAGGNQETLVVDIMKDMDNATIYSAGLEDNVWTFARVHRIATTVMGLEKSVTKIDGSLFAKALNLLAASDEVKFEWGAAELRKEDNDVDNVLNELNGSEQSKKGSTAERLKQLRKTCNTHEKKLLGGVINPADIHTTFDEVHAPKETIEALKMLTTLSLLRPEAFSYGVLATDKIPGLLLYGPPGTGKTLLAKAVAKESGATVLDVSGADVNDMYVGEGEKNVKAIFTLAKKLSPCVVFIDEADAIFAARGEARRSSTHRELINQFLREWDGMNDLSAFIMVATNRPFDLDEAVLRRLPRRLLVDLPVEKDRESILKIHLKDENLDDSVSLSKLAKDTPYYSGSDLKNLSVAAALACIREENEIAAKHTGDEPYVYPAKRTLTKQHFDKAMEEISASISEDMSTLAAIRKFDEKYGDRKGRRKKSAGLGFGGTTVPEKDSEAGRVRKVQV